MNAGNEAISFCCNGVMLDELSTMKSRSTARLPDGPKSRTFCAASAAVPPSVFAPADPVAPAVPTPPVVPAASLVLASVLAPPVPAPADPIVPATPANPPPLVPAAAFAPAPPCPLVPAPPCAERPWPDEQAASPADATTTANLHTPPRFFIFLLTVSRSRSSSQASLRGPVV